MLQGLEQLINLEDLFLNDNQLESVDNLQQCVKLSELRLSANKIATGAGIPSKLLIQLNVNGYFGRLLLLISPTDLANGP